MKLDIKNKTKIINEKLKDRFLKDKENFSKVKKNIQDKIQNLFDWVKGAELVELEKCDIKDDPVRPELTNEFRTSYGRKIFGVKYQNEIHAIAYTVWSKKKGGGKLIVKEVYKMIKKSNHLNRLVTLSPLTEMARKFHLRNGAVELQVNEHTQNFEYIVIK